jgi:hypothetical protein
LLLHVDMLRTTTLLHFAPTHEAETRPGRGGIAVAENFGVGWVLMLVFAVGGLAGMVLAALMVVAGANSAREEHNDWSE